MKCIRLFLTLMGAIFVFSSSSILHAQTRRALVIGLGQQEDKAWGKINGDKDVLYVDKILRMRSSRLEI